MSSHAKATHPERDIPDASPTPLQATVHTIRPKTDDQRLEDLARQQRRIQRGPTAFDVC